MFVCWNSRNHSSNPINGANDTNHGSSFLDTMNELGLSQHCDKITHPASGKTLDLLAIHISRPAMRLRHWWSNNNVWAKMPRLTFVSGGPTTKRQSATEITDWSLKDYYIYCVYVEIHAIIHRFYTYVGNIWASVLLLLRQRNLIKRGYRTPHKEVGIVRRICSTCFNKDLNITYPCLAAVTWTRTNAWVELEGTVGRYKVLWCRSTLHPLQSYRRRRVISSSTVVTLAASNTTKATQCRRKTHRRRMLLQVRPKTASVGIQCLLLADTTDKDVTEQEECDNDSDNSAASFSDYVISTRESNDSIEEDTVDNTSFSNLRFIACTQISSFCFEMILSIANSHHKTG